MVLDGFEELVVAGPERRDLAEVEAWLEALLPDPESRWGGEPPARFFLESYMGLRANGWGWREALCIAWMSLGRDDRGGLNTVADLCDFLGVSRMWFYEHKTRYENEPAQGLNAWDWWAERLQLARLRGHRLAEVDEATFRRAVSFDGKAADRELYYKRAGVLVSKSEVVATVGQTVDVAELDEAALDALLAREPGVLPEVVEGEGEGEDGENTGDD